MAQSCDERVKVLEGEVAALWVIIALLAREQTDVNWYSLLRAADERVGLDGGAAIKECLERLAKSFPTPR